MHRIVLRAAFRSHITVRAAGRATLLLLVVLLALASLPPGMPAAAQEAPPIDLPPGGFVEADGTQLVRLGQPVQLKGAFYLTDELSVDEMWRFWDSSRIAHDMRLAGEHLGLNTVWVRMPYNIEHRVALDGTVHEELITRMREVVQAAGEHNMRVVFTLFAGYDDFPMPGKRSEDKNIRYLEHVIGNFAGDERVLGWDMYYKPDRHALWRAGEHQRVLNWLVRMANQAQRLAPHQLVMVSMDNYRNLWRTDFEGLRLSDQVDVILLRSGSLDDIDELVDDLDAVRARSDQPIVVYEFAWSSGPPCRTATYTEEQQAFKHYEAFDTVLHGGLAAGVFLRTLYDVDGGPLDSWDEPRFYEGVFRPDGSVKPVAEQIRIFPTPPLPMVTTSNLPYRTLAYPPGETEDPDAPLDRYEPAQVYGSPFYVKNWFRRAWDGFGGPLMFGMPLGNAYRRAHDKRAVHYFEAAVLEYHDDADRDEDFVDASDEEKIYTLLRPVNLGEAYTAGRTFPLPTEHVDGARFFPETGHLLYGLFHTFYDRMHGEWRLGAPISEPLEEEIDGVLMQVQYFELGRLEIDPATQDVRFGKLGLWAYDVQCAFAP